MPIESRPDRRLAVLIDADNASARIADGLFEEIAKLGEASVRRVYGDSSSPRSKAWADVLARHAIVWQQQHPHTVGKNSSDIALVIDAMDLMHSKSVDDFCLVSSDSDFTWLALRLREHGAGVFGFGEQKTPESFRQACRRFIYTEDLLPLPPATTEQACTNSVRPVTAAIRIIRDVIAQMDTDDGWVALGAVGNQLANLDSGFDSRSYGFRKLSDLVRGADAFDIVQPKDAPLRIRLRIKTSKGGPVRPAHKPQLAASA